MLNPGLKEKCVCMWGGIDDVCVAAGESGKFTLKTLNVDLQLWTGSV